MTQWIGFRGTGSIPGLGRFYAAEQLSLCAATTEPVCLEPVLCNKRSYHNEKPEHHNEE